MKITLNLIETPEIAAAVEKFIALRSDEMPLFLVDDTMFNSAKAGLLGTTKRLVVFERSTQHSIEWGSGVKVRLTRDTISVHHRLEVIEGAAKRLDRTVIATGGEITKLAEILEKRVAPENFEFFGTGEMSDRTRMPRRVHRPPQGMIVTGTPTIEGHPVETYLGLVSGEAVLGANFFADLAASIGDVLGGRISAYEDEFISARERAFQLMTNAASSVGANAIVNVQVTYQDLGRTNSILMVAANGTAVIVA